MNEFIKNNQELLKLIEEWEPKLLALTDAVITHRPNNECWSIKEILGHMFDSASNNTHRIIHLQYQPSPLAFPNYASSGNNDKWVAIQNYQGEKWHDLVRLWKYANIHIVHVINNVNENKLGNEWVAEPGKKVSLKSMIDDYLGHFRLHIGEIDDLIKKQKIK
jgi:hypothetical protein